jgi:acyl carrier protein
MTATSTTAALKEILADLRDDPQLRGLDDAASLLDDVGLDSLELLQFMLEVEAHLGVEIEFERLSYDDLGSLETLATFLDAMPRRCLP